MTDPEVLERLAARRAELDGLEEQRVKQLAEVRSERDELAVAERVLLRMAEQIAAERDTASSPVAHVAGRAVRLVPDRAPGGGRVRVAGGVPAHPGRGAPGWGSRGDPGRRRDAGPGHLGAGQAGAAAREADEARSTDKCPQPTAPWAACPQVTTPF
ncbi:hypothetical protein [Streptomyces sp. NPDC002088]|uniref:hypothetical protein n=1 Tax=Streptomyces sp. NPDC002088 TaxID=3154665 RepID=UPI00332FC7EA